MKRKALVALFCIMGLMLAVGVAQANVYTCSIQQASVNNGGFYLVYLTDTAATPGWTGSIGFLIPTGTQTITNAMYATALTALSKGSNVVIDVFVPAGAPGPVAGSVLFSLTSQ